jgi:hypothetical protein
LAQVHGFDKKRKSIRATLVFINKTKNNENISPVGVTLFGLFTL